MTLLLKEKFVYQRSVLFNCKSKKETAKEVFYAKTREKRKDF